jgi:hypothetical protein
MIPVLDAASSDSLLRSVPHEYASMPWTERQHLVDKQSNYRTDLRILSKESQADASEARPAVLKILARARVPVEEIMETFKDPSPETVREWNPFAGEVTHLSKDVQLQTYSMPWPFVSREYLVRCEESRPDSKGLQAHCRSINEHPSAPLRDDRVRGHSETVWRFTSHKNGETSIHMETIIDPRGGVPAWVVDKVSKSTAVRIVRSLIKYSSNRHSKKKGAPSGSDADCAAEAGSRDGGVLGALWAKLGSAANVLSDMAETPRGVLASLWA